MDFKERANTLDLTKPLDASLLESLELEEIETIKRILIERAVAVIGEIQELKARSPFEKEQYRRRMFRGEHRLETGELVFNYSCEPRFTDLNLFVPGEWFASELKELDALRARKSENTETFEERHRQKLIDELCGTPKPKKREAAAVS